MQVAKCPVCNGTGRIQTGIVPAGTNAVIAYCHGCGGKGWIGVRESDWVTVDPAGHITHAPPAKTYQAHVQCGNCHQGTGWVSIRRGTTIQKHRESLICKDCGCPMGGCPMGGGGDAREEAGRISKELAKRISDMFDRLNRCERLTDKETAILICDIHGELCGTIHDQAS